jgi:iron(III) transport system substrate-binding protein
MSTALLRASFLATALAVSGPAIAAETFDLAALIAAAQKEPPITVLDSTGKITDMAKGFSAKYGVKATGQKAKVTGQIEMMIREAQAGKVQGDVSIISDVPAAVAQLIPQKFGVSWVPPDLAPGLAETARDPLIVVSSANVLAYNTKLYDRCPITNIWQLTEAKWKARLAMQDPLGKPSYTDWFNQMRTYNDDAIRAAYEKHFGKPLRTDKGSATEAWVAAIAANAPLLTDADAAAGQAVAAPGQTEPFIGIVSTAKFRDNDAAGYTLGVCSGVDPFIGFLSSGVGLIASGTRSPNAARLFIHYAMTAEGIAPQADDGKISSNRSVGLPPDEPSGIGKHIDQVLAYNPASALNDFDTRQDWQDFWRLNYRK